MPSEAVRSFRKARPAASAASRISAGKIWPDIRSGAAFQVRRPQSPFGNGIRRVPDDYFFSQGSAAKGVRPNWLEPFDTGPPDPRFVIVEQPSTAVREYEEVSEVAAVVFDWYNTLAAPHPDDFWAHLPELITSAGGTPDQQALHDWDSGHPIEHQEHSTSEATYRAWQGRRLERLFDQSGVPEHARSQLVADIDGLRYTRLFTVFPDVAPVLSQLRDRGITVGICSNWDWGLDRQLRHNSLSELVDFVVCSAIHGYRKPHPAIFASVIAQAGLPPDQIVFVGDNLSDDIAGAAKAGLRPVHIARQGLCPPGDHDGVPCLRDFDQLPDLLG